MFPGTVTVCAIVNEVNVSVTSAKLEPSFNLLGIFLNCLIPTTENERPNVTKGLDLDCDGETPGVAGVGYTCNTALVRERDTEASLPCGPQTLPDSLTPDRSQFAARQSGGHLDE
jgi:hypothetical protein